MLKSVYHFDQERLSTADIESGYSVTKTLNNLYEKHGSIKKHFNNSSSPTTTSSTSSSNHHQSSGLIPSSRLLTASQIIKANEKFARKPEVILTNKQLDLIEILVRQKASMLLSALNESANMHKRHHQQQIQHHHQHHAFSNVQNNHNQSSTPQPQTQPQQQSNVQQQQQHHHNPPPTPIPQAPLPQTSLSQIPLAQTPIPQLNSQHLIQLDVNVVNDLKKVTNKRMITQSKPENKKLAIGSPLCCKSTSSISFTANIIEPSAREIKARRRNSIERLRSSNQESSKKEFKTSKTKDYSNRYGKSKHRKSRKVTIMMKIKEESENELELENNLSNLTQDENKAPESTPKPQVISNEEPNSEIETNNAIENSDYSSLDDYKEDLSEISDFSCSEISVTASVYQGVEDLDCYKDYKKILLSLAQKVPKKCVGSFC